MIDGQRVRQHRLELGLSVRALARRIGVSPGVIERIERSNGGARLQLATVDRLATSLAMTLPELLVSPAAVSEQPTLLEHPAEELAVAIGAAVVRAGRLVPVHALAQQTGCSLDDVHDALAILAERLPRVGARLHRLGASIAIRAADSAGAETGDASRATIDANGVTRAQASVLLSVVTGQLDMRTLTPSERGALGLLGQLGVVDTDDVPTLSATAYDDLLVDARDLDRPRRASDALRSELSTEDVT